MIEILKKNNDIWDQYTKKEEYKPISVDIHKRFSYYSSKYNVFFPKVSDYLINNKYKIYYPHNKKFAVCLTHDIDTVYLNWKSRISSSLKSISSKKLHNGISNLFKPNPYFNFNDIMDLEKKYNAKSSFYIITATKDISNDSRYNPNDLKISLKNIIERGWEVGLHGGYYSYDNAERMKREKNVLENIIGNEIMGYRNHYLKFKTPDTWELLLKSGFKYDVTFGYANCVGFRNGLCHPFKPYNIVKKKVIDILEMPLTIMDSTLFSYMQLDINNAWIITKKLIDIVEKLNGVLCILWHNTYFEGEKLEFYKRILNYCNKKNSWMTSGEDIYKWWNDKLLWEVKDK